MAGGIDNPEAITTDPFANRVEIHESIGRVAGEGGIEVTEIQYWTKPRAEAHDFKPTIHSFTGKDRLRRAKKQAFTLQLNAPAPIEVIVVKIRQGREIQVWQKRVSGVA